MYSLYFVNELGILTSNHGYEVAGIKSISSTEYQIHTLLFSLIV